MHILIIVSNIVCDDDLSGSQFWMQQFAAYVAGEFPTTKVRLDNSS